MTASLVSPRLTAALLLPMLRTLIDLFPTRVCERASAARCHALRRSGRLRLSWLLGGNAQYLSRDRWLHHTSFLWKCDTALFARYLTLPPKRPQYREDRAHADFVRTLDKLVPSKRELVDAIVEELETLADVVPISMDELARKRTKERSHCLFVPPLSCPTCSRR